MNEPAIDTIGTCPSPHAAISRGISGLAVILTLIQIRHPFGLDIATLALLGLVGVLCLNGGDGGSLGMRQSPVQGWWYWFRLALLFGAVIMIALTIYAIVILVSGTKVITYQVPPSLHGFLYMCVYAPIVEEVIFRVLLVAAVFPTVGKWGSILISGFVFALAHVLNGNASPENQLAGFMLGWTYLKSKTILVPLAMHSGGNLFAWASQAANWYWEF